MGNVSGKQKSKGDEKPRNSQLVCSPWPVFGKSEIDAVVSVLKSGRVNAWTGNEVKAFEQQFAQSVGVEYALAVANGTVALELALWALDIGPGDEVVTSSRTFIATASSIVMRGAVPVFADVDPDSQNVTAESIRVVITPRTKAIIVVHLGGWPCEMLPILKLASEHNLKVVEDCAQAQGAVYRGRPVGSWGDIGTFSFCQDKIMTTGGEGGMLTTNNQRLWENAWSYKDHGKSLGALERSTHPPGFKWLHENFGTNWRMTEMQAAIGRVTLKRIPLWLEMRHRNARAFRRAFRAIDALRMAQPPRGVRHAYYKFYAFVRPERLKLGWDRDRILAAILEEGASCFSGSCSEIYLEKAFQSAGLQPQERLPIARELGENSLMFLVHPTLNTEELEQTCHVVARVFERATATQLCDAMPSVQRGKLVDGHVCSSAGSQFSEATEQWTGQ